MAALHRAGCHGPVSEPGAMALYLALGWRQALVTRRWPRTERWRACFAHKADHWLPRLFQYLCYLVAKPDNLEYLAGAHGALAEGRADDQLPGYADFFPQALLPTSSEG